MKQKETQKLKHKLLIKGLSMLAATAALTGAVGQQSTVLGALILNQQCLMPGRPKHLRVSK